jgi:hypothetical protein
MRYRDELGIADVPPVKAVMTLALGCFESDEGNHQQSGKKFLFHAWTYAPTQIDSLTRGNGHDTVEVL